MFDVIIIGAGPSGTAAAFDLVSAGLKVLILDKHEFPRKKACAGGITPKGFNLFRYDISPLVKRVCHTIKITRHDASSFDIRSEQPLCHMTVREELDAHALSGVIEKGAVFMVTGKIRQITEEDSGVTVRTDIGAFRSKFLIGADGANSRVRRLLAGGRRFRLYPALEADVPVKDPGRFKMEFDFSSGMKGYYWIFPKHDHVNIGIYAVGNGFKPKKQQLMRYAETKLGTGRLISLKGYPICTGGYRYRPARGHILLTGDAAGMTESLLGEGIFFAVKSGQLAAKAILGFFRGIQAPVLKRYDQSLKLLRLDLRLYRASSGFYYTFPRLSQIILSQAFFHRRFVEGYAKGNTLSQILFKKQVNLK